MALTVDITERICGNKKTDISKLNKKRDFVKSLFICFKNNLITRLFIVLWGAIYIIFLLITCSNLLYFQRIDPKFDLMCYKHLLKLLLIWFYHLKFLLFF